MKRPKSNGSLDHALSTPSMCIPLAVVGAAALVLAVSIPRRARAELPDVEGEERRSMSIVDMEASASAADFLASGAKLTMGGLRGSSVTVRGSDGDERVFSVLLASRMEAFAQDGWVSVHRLQYGSIGGGSGGFEAELGGILEGGARIRIGGRHGAVMRGGVQAFLGGNQTLYSSLLELPRVLFAYQLLSRRVLFESGAQGGLVLAGCYNAGEDADRNLGVSFDWGWYASFQRAPARLDLSFMRVEARRTGAGTPVDMVRGAACGYAGRIAFCTESRYLRGDLEGPRGATPRGVESFYFGFTVGLATVSF